MSSSPPDSHRLRLVEDVFDGSDVGPDRKCRARPLTRKRIARDMTAGQRPGGKLGRPLANLAVDARARGLTANKAAQLVRPNRPTFQRQQQHRFER